MTEQDIKRHAFLMEHGLGNFYKLAPDHVGYITGSTMEKLVDLALAAPTAAPARPNLGDTYEPTMNIHAQPGTVVRFRAGGGYDWEKKSAIEAGFVRNALYTVKRCDVGHSKTEVLFDEVGGRWNSCLFADLTPSTDGPELESLETGESDAIDPSARRIAG